MSGGLITILDGSTFVTGDRTGNVKPFADDLTGLFSRDTRFLSTWVLTIDGRGLNELSVDDLNHYEARFFLTAGSRSVRGDAAVCVIRDRVIHDGFREVVTIHNYGQEPVDLTVRIDTAADFADLFEATRAPVRKGECYTHVENRRLVYGYHREAFRRETVISARAADQVDEHGLTFAAHVDRHGSWTTEVQVTTVFFTARGTEPLPGGRRIADTEGVQEAGERMSSVGLNLERELTDWIAAAPRLNCDWSPLTSTYRRSLVDLAALRFSPLIARRRAMPAAGTPWFMTLFGRDSILTSLQTLPFLPELAATTLMVLGRNQGTRCDDFRAEEPGRILHEFRYGELAAFGEQPQTPDYHAADATPLFVILLDEYERWTGDAPLVRRLEGEARAALAWIDDYGDSSDNGYLSYVARPVDGRPGNQSWKTSWDAVSYRNGDLPNFPRATCELQGYAYDAKMRGARLAREIWADPDLADRLESEAADLKARFNRDFWIEDGQYFAIALDADGRRVDALSSNIGHLLWSGIVEDAKSAAVARHLMGPSLFTGWGIRTLAEGEGRYNPIGYHVGTVWPFDNSFVAWGLRRYGYDEEAASIATGMLDAAAFFDGRLPEAFAGFPRELTRYPVPYPSACSPQAWSAGAPLLLMRTMLGLDAADSHLVVDPALPRSIGRIELLDVPGRWGRVDAFARGKAAAEAAPRLRPETGTMIEPLTQPT